MTNLIKAPRNVFHDLPDVLPVGSVFTLTVQDAGISWNREYGAKLAKPGEYIQFKLTNGSKEIRIMRIAISSEIKYCVHFGPDLPECGLGDYMTIEELRAAVDRYLTGKLFSEGG